MAATNKSKAEAAAKAAQVGTEAGTETTAYVTADQLDSFGANLISQVADLIAANKPAPVAAVETPLDKEIKKAGPNVIQTNPEWEELSRGILGEALDHTEFQYMKTGGVVFTIVIKPEHSNAKADYMAMMGQDRRSKEIGQEGSGGVEAWCKMVKQNLTKVNQIA